MVNHQSCLSVSVHFGALVQLILRLYNPSKSSRQYQVKIACSAFPGETKVISVFEGFMDFLTYLMEEGVVKAKEDILVLNSLSFQQRARVFIEKGGYERILTFFDNDQTGNKANESFIEQFKEKANSQNFKYENFKDYNDKLKA